MNSKRTLTFKGEKYVQTLVKAINDVTHSYTLMPILGMDGKIKGKTLICLQEVNGKFGPIVKQQLIHRSNILLTCSKSGKLTKSHIKWW